MKVTLANNSPVVLDVPTSARHFWIVNRTGTTVYILPPNARADGEPTTQPITIATNPLTDGVPVENGQDRYFTRGDEASVINGPWQFRQNSGNSVDLDYALGF